MKFDPFNDRTARDLRNSLSSALVAELAGSAAGYLAQAVSRWQLQSLPAVYRAYLEERQMRYEAVLMHIRSAQIEDPRRQAVVLWNAGLFFEMHELLETLWHDAVEPERSALKGLIQAAGAYLHAQRGHLQAASGIGRRARTHLQASAAALGFIANLDQLIEALRKPASNPPELYLNPPPNSGGQQKTAEAP